MADEIRIRMDAERVLDLVTVDEYIALEQFKVEAVRDVLGKFVVGPDGNFLPEEEGQALMGKQPMRKLLELNDMLVNQAKDGAAPLPNEPDSEGQS